MFGVDIFLHRCELRLDPGEVLLSVSERLCVSEWLSDALVGVGSGLLGIGEIGAGLLEERGNAGDTVLDALDQAGAAFEE